MALDFIGRSKGKFPGAKEHLKRLSPVCPDGIFQSAIGVPFLQSHLRDQYQAFVVVFR